MASCPNINSPEFKALESLYGKQEATLLYHMNNEVMPTIKQAATLLGVQSTKNLPSLSNKDLYYQLGTSEVEQANKELDQFLLDYLKPFGIIVKDIEELKKRFDVKDALGVADVLNKVIYLSKGNRRIDTMAEEAAHIITMLMGRDHPLFQQLFNNIERHSTFNEVYREYMPIYNNLEQVKKEAVDKLIAEAIVNGWKVKGTKEEKNLLQKFIDAIKKWWDSFINKNQTFSEYTADKKVSPTAAIIAEKILSGDSSLINKVEGKEQLDYIKALSGNEHAKNTINLFTDYFGFRLTGSLAIAAQGERINRPSESPIHDLDFVVSKDFDIKKMDEYMKNMGAIPTHSGIFTKTSRGDVSSTYAYLVPAEGYTVEAAHRTSSKYWREFADEVILRDNKGKEIFRGKWDKAPADKLLNVDFFDNYEKNEETAGKYKSWQDIYFGKMVLSNLGDKARMFPRAKDQTDYIESNPVQRDNIRPEFLYYQREGTSYSDIKLIEPTYEDFSNIKDFGERYAAITKRKNELQEQGAQISGLTDKGFRWIPNQKDDVKYQLDSSSRPVEEKLDQQLTKFLRSLGVSVEKVKEIMSSKGISAAAMTDTINKIIKIADGKAGIDTLPEEVAHVFIDMLPANSTLLRDLLKDVRTRDIYRKVMDKYGDLDEYKKEDGTVDEDKIAREAAGQLVAAAIVQEFEDSKAKSLWKRLWDYIKQLFKGKELLTPYKQIAKEILKGKISKLQPTLGGKGIYYQLEKDEEELIRNAIKKANPIQVKVIEEVYFKPHNRYRLDRKTHIYTDSAGNPYTSLTTAMGVDFPEDRKDEFEANRDWGNDVDQIMQDICLRKKFKDIKTKVLSEEVKAEVYSILSEYYGELSAGNCIVLPQVIVADEQTKVAGTIDLLVIDPYGNMRVIDIKSSWNRHKDSSSTTKYALKPSSRILQNTANGPKPVTKITKLQQHGAQIGSYAKMLELQGWYVNPINGLATKHIYLKRKVVKDAEGNESTIIQSAEEDGEDVRKPSDNYTLIQALIPTPLTSKDRLQEINDEFGIGNPIRQSQNQDPAKVIIPEDIEEKLDEKFDEINEGIRKFSEELEELKHKSGGRWEKDASGKLIKTAKFKVREDTVERVDKLYEELSTALSHESRTVAYGKFLDFMEQQLTNISKFLTDKDAKGEFPKNIDNIDYLNIALLAQKFISSFNGILNLKVFGTAEQAIKLSQVVQMLNDTNKDIDFAIKQYNMRWTSQTTSRKNLTKENLEAYVTKDRDVTNNELNFGTLGNSGVFIIENADKKIKARFLAAKEIAEQMINEFVLPASEKLRVANGGKITANMYDFMMRKDREGKRMGQIVSQIGRVYREKQDKIYSQLSDIEGHVFNYKEISDLDVATEEDIQYNIDLYYKKEAKRKFDSAEEFDEDGNTSSGEYHKYSDEFLAEREKYMYKEPVGGTVKKVNGEWTRVNANWRWEFYEGKTPESNAEIIAFKRKYFREIPNYLSAEFKKGKPTGRVTEKFSLWVPKAEYVEVRDTVKSTGEVIADKGYYELMNPSTELGRAQKEFYMMYVDTMIKIQDMLPTDAAEIFKRGGIPSLGANWVQKIGNGDVNAGVLMANAIKASFQTPVAMGKDVAANSGSVRQKIPLLYVSPLQSQLQIDKITTALTELESKKSKLSEVEYVKQKKYLDNLMKREKGKMKATDLHPDLSIGLVEILKAATQFQAKSDIESDLQAVNTQLLNMEFEQEVTRFGVVVGKKTVSGIQSNAYKRFNGWLNMCFYNDPLMDKSTADKIVKRLMSYTSALGVSFNPMGWVNNSITGTLGNFVDSLGDDFYNASAMRRMSTVEFPKAMVGYMRSMMEHKVKGSTYEKKKAGSKYEWLCDFFNAIQKNDEDIRGDINWLAKVGGYSGMEAGEYMMQSKVANSILASIPIKNSITGEEVMLYDAFEFDEKSGTAKLKDGFELTDKERYDITNRIRETIDRIHGNYSAINKTMFEREWWGKLMMQFHKWVYPNLKSRIQRGKYDENLGGGMDIEGRYRTVWGFVTKLNSLADLTSGDAWGRLTKHQKSNVKKSLADAAILCVLFATAHVLAMIADDVPDDDPDMKRWVHWLQLQNDRSIAEIGLFVPPLGFVEGYKLFKNPIPAASLVREFAELLQASYQYPFLDDEHRYYQRGVYEGMSHLAKESRDLFPIFKEYNRMRSLINNNKLFIK